MKWIFLLLGVSAHLFTGSFDLITPSTPDEIASLNADLLIDGYVSAMSGQLSLAETDLQVRGAQDVVLKRIYLPPQILGRYHDHEKRDQLELGNALLQLNSKGWVILPHLWAGYNRNSPYFQLRDPQGYVLEFEIRGNRGVLQTSSLGCSNLRSGEPSSAADIRNIELYVEEDQIQVIWPNGIKRIYIHQALGRYRLNSELLPNGKAIRYDYDQEAPVHIYSTDASGKHTYASIDRLKPHHYRGSDGKEAHFTYETREIKGKDKKKEADSRCSPH